MATGEGLPKDLAWLDWETPEFEPVEPLLRRAFDADSAANIANGRAESLFRWAEDFKLSLLTPSYGNELAVNVEMPSRMSRRHINIGYFSPTDADFGDFLIYPEAFEAEGSGLTASELEIVKIHAFNSRVKDIDEFNRDQTKRYTGASRLDYGNPAVQSLHREHFAYLGGINLSELLDEYNFIRVSADSQEQQLYADEATRAAICLHAKYDGGKTIQDHYLSLRMQGAYKLDGENKDIKNRQLKTFIHIAERDPENPKEFFQIDRIIPPYELSTYVELALSVEELAAQFMGAVVLNKQELGLRVPPMKLAE
jgi:hypothetical protein